MRPILVWRAATAALLILTALLAWPLVGRYREQPPPPPPALRLSLTVVAGTELGAGDDGLDAAISPDGAEIAVVATSDGRVQIWRRHLDDDRGAPIPGTDGGGAPAWSPDGRRLAFVAGGRLKEVTFESGAVRDVAAAAAPGGVAWLDDGALVFPATMAGPLTMVRGGATSAATTLQPGDRAHAWPSHAPGGFLYTALRDDGRRIMRLSAGGATHDLGATDGHAQLAGDILLYVSGGALLAQRLDATRGTLQGRATVLATGVGATDGRALVAVSPRLLVYSAAATRARELVWVGADGTRDATASDRGDYWQVRVAPDDSAAAVTQLEPQLRTLDVYTIPLRPGAVSTSLTLALAADTDPVWSPDGRDVVFRSLQGGSPRLLARAAGRPGAPVEPVLQSSRDAFPTDWRTTAGGRGELLFHAETARRDTDLFVLDRASGGGRAIVSSSFNESDGRWAPGGGLLAYVSDEFGQPDVFVQAWPAGARVRVTTAGGIKPRWRRDGRTLIFVRGSELTQVIVAAGEPLSISPPAVLATLPGMRDFDTAHRSDRLLAILPAPAAGPVNARALVDWQSAVPGP